MRQTSDRSLRIYLDAVASYSALTRSDAAKWGLVAGALEAAFRAAVLTGSFVLPPGPQAHAIELAADRLRTKS